MHKRRSLAIAFRCWRSLVILLQSSYTPYPYIANSRRSTQSCFLRVLSEASDAGARCRVCYYAAHDTCGSNLRIAEAAGSRTTTRAGNVCEHLWVATVPDRRQEPSFIRVRRFAPAGYGSGARAAPFEYSGDAEG